MITLYESILDDIDAQIKKGDDDIKTEIRNFIKDNYFGRFKISAKPNRHGLYEVSSRTNIRITNADLQQLTNGMFVWTEIDGSFVCRCTHLTTLEGGPTYVGLDFDISWCTYLKSLKYGPRVVGNFYCQHCTSLESLKYAPKTVKGRTTITNCDKIDSLEGMPARIMGYLYHDFSWTSIDEIKKVSKVDKEIRNYYTSK
jgi:hypothetical protein